MASRKFLGYLVTQRDIEADPNQIFAILDMQSPTCVKVVQMMNRRLAALNRFISRSTIKCMPFFQTLKKNGANFSWNEKCEMAFQELKRYLTSPPLLSKLSSGETLYLYLVVSELAVSRALVQEDEGVQKQVYYASHSMNGPQTRYQRLEKMVLALFIISRKLKHYCQIFPVTILTEHP